MKKGLILMLILFALSFVAGCGSTNAPQDINSPEHTGVIKDNNQQKDASKSEETAAYPLEVTDFRGNSVKLAKEPQRVISLSPNITEIIYALGKGDTLVGRTAFCDYPEDAEDAIVVGDFIEWNFETILSLEPDVVFASSLNTEENENKLMELGINTVFLTQIESFESTYEIIDLVGKVLNAQDRADEIINEMKKTVSEVQKAAEGKEKPSVYYVVGYGEYGDYTATGETFISSMIGMAGGNNIAADITGWVYSLEKLIEKDPDIIICPEYAKEAFLQTNGYKELTAVKEGRIYAIDENLIVRQGPRLAEGLRALYEIFHSESISD
ncbi:MAG: ABC transporter substrate-binding protein [Clostridiaceae bacterium]|nr:ABC transporter substrate-binding protein [Clostridiaceae bacterium]